MKLADQEMAMLDEGEGKARRKAMDLLVRYGEAPGAAVLRCPSVTDFDQDPLTIIETGDWVMLDADRGSDEVRKMAAASRAS